MISSARHATILGVSDVSLGYGSPQVPTLLESLADHYPGCDALVLEPDQSEFRPQPGRFPRLRIERVATRFHPHSPPGMIEYNTRVARTLDALAPDILVFSSPVVIPSLLRARHRPRFCIYYMLESLAHYDGAGSSAARFLLDAHRQARSRIDLVVFPEENRAAADIVRAGYETVPLVVCYNSINRAAVAKRDEPLPTKNRRLLYSGTIDPHLTLADFFLEPEVRAMPLDLWGVVGGRGKEAFEQALHGDGELRYCGYVDSLRLAELRKRYAYSLILWSPANENTLYACPNKLFEAIADGVPPISTPHPQCKMLIERYDCGIVLDDWSLDAFLRGTKHALDLFGTPRYDELVANCRLAAERELNWDVQFEKIRSVLPPRLSQSAAGLSRA